MAELPKNYDTKETEARWQKNWEDKGVYRWEKDLPRDQTYVIDTPPPTVSGHLHMGHIFSYTQADFVARYQRMSGKTVFYPMGFDDNGLPTERLVEKTKKVRAVDMSREAFIKLCEEVAAEARRDFRALFTSVALSVDWQQEYYTISEHSRRISQLSFLDLHKQGAAYRQLQPMLWDPVDQTAIAQAEVVDKEMPSHFNDIYFEVVDKDGQPLSEKKFGGRKLKEEGKETAIVFRDGKSYIVIGTTRPELIPACVGIFFHPEDARYIGLEGAYAITPLFGVKVKILTDDTVEPTKGTGIMMCCTFGDEADIEKWRKHKLDTRLILNKFGKIAPPPESGTGAFWDKIAGKKVSNPDPKHLGARETMLALLQEHGLLIKSEPITHAVKCAERSGAPLEILPTPQWFVKVLEAKDKLKARSKAANWYPTWMEKRMEQWIDGLNWDWCVSRQRYFGVPFPVWYSKRAGEEGKILLADADQLPVNPLTDLPKGYSREEVEPDMDVMDTWATSSVSPQINAHALLATDAKDRERYAKLFPADLRPQAHEIIRTWAFYTVVKAHYHSGCAPWHNLMISGWCLAADKSKMSKSKGNVVTPTGLIEQHGADAVRYWASTSRLGSDTAFSEDLLKIGRKLVTKLWNATKFAAAHLDNIVGVPTTAKGDVETGRITEALDKWILSRLAKTVKIATEEFERYEYCDARVAVEEFFWKDFCDNYLELCKTRAYGEGGVSVEARSSAAFTLYHCLNTVLKLFAPFTPHVTEELYSHIFAKEFASQGSLHGRGRWPKVENFKVHEEAEKAGEAAVSLLGAIRKIKAERNVSIKYPLTAVNVEVHADAAVKTLPESTLFDLKHTSSAADIRFGGTPLEVAVDSEDGHYRLSATFAPESEVKSA